MLCFLLPAAGVQGGCTQWGTGEEAQGESLALGRVLAQPLRAWDPPSEEGPAGAGRTAAQPARHLTMGSGERWRLAEGDSATCLQGQQTLRGVSPSLLCWNARKGVCVGQVFVSQRHFSG